MDRWREREFWGWGRYPRVRAFCARPERRREVTDAVADRRGSPVLGFGLGRSYGDAALIEGGRVVLTERLDRMLGFDPKTGWLRCESGVSIKTLIDTFVPRGFFPPVVPGTQFVTVGGALANDIHGKNHHVDGTFGDHVRRVELLTGRGDVVVCDAETEPDLFWATVGGLGLTGLILSLEVKLQAIDGPLIEMDSIRIENLDHFFEVNAESNNFTHTVSWIDCVTSGEAVGRGIYMRGRHAGGQVRTSGSLLGRLADKVSHLLDVPVDGPGWLMNPVTMRAFNTAYFHKHPKGKRSAVTALEPFFFPLDFVRNWNRVYGQRGMLQYQLVVPHDPEHAAIREVLDAVTKAGMASFLSVIKTFGDRAHGGLSFPMPGVTLALDFPNTGAPLLALLDRLDEIVAHAGGRVYLGKDARLSRRSFEMMYLDAPAWKDTRDRWDPKGVFQSELGRRLGLVGSRK